MYTGFVQLNQLQPTVNASVAIEGGTKRSSDMIQEQLSNKKARFIETSVTPFDHFPQEIFISVMQFLDTESRGRFASSSSILHSRTVHSIASDAMLLSKVLSKLLKRSDEEQFVEFLEALNKVALIKTIPIDLTIDVSTMWYACSNAIKKIQTYFPNIQSISYVGGSKLSQHHIDKLPALPSSVKELVIGTCTVRIHKLLNETINLRRLDARGCTGAQVCQLVSHCSNTIELFITDFQKDPEEDTRFVIDLLEKMIEKRPNGVASYLIVLLLLKIPGLSDSLRVHKLLEESVRTAPRLVNAKTHLGMLLMKSQPDRARELFEESIVIAPAYALAHFKLGELFLQRGIEKGRDYLDQAEALCLKERDFLLLLDIAEVLASKDEQKSHAIVEQVYSSFDRLASRAIVQEFLTKIVSIHPKHIFATVELVELLIVQGKRDETGRYLEVIRPLCAEQKNLSGLVALAVCCSCLTSADLVAIELEPTKLEAVADCLSSLISMRDDAEKLCKLAKLILESKGRIGSLFVPHIHSWIRRKKVKELNIVYTFLRDHQVEPELRKYISEIICKIDITDQYKAHLKFAERVIQEDPKIAEKILKQVASYALENAEECKNLYFLILNRIYDLLVKSKALPRKRKQILEVLINADDLYIKNKAREQLAALLFSEGQDSVKTARPKQLIQEAGQYALRSSELRTNVDDVLEDHKILPEMRRQLLKRYLKSSPDDLNAMLSLAVLLLSGKGIVARDLVRAGNLLKEAALLALAEPNDTGTLLTICKLLEKHSLFPEIRKQLLEPLVERDPKMIDSLNHC